MAATPTPSWRRCCNNCAARPIRPNGTKWPSKPRRSSKPTWPTSTCWWCHSSRPPARRSRATRCTPATCTSSTIKSPWRPRREAGSHQMFAYIAQRLVGAVSVLFVVSVVSFGLYALTPGDPAVVLLEAAGIHSPPPDAVAAKRLELHLNDPLPVQYIQWLGGALRGDFGRSFRSYTPVSELYLSRIGATGLLAVCATVLSIVIALPLGILAAYRRGQLADAIAQIVVALGGSMPGFWIGLLLVLLFAVNLHWLPAFGSPTPTGIVLPAIVLAVANIAVLTRLTRSAVLDVLNQEFVTVAHAKGLAPRRVTLKHVLPNIFVPLLTVLGLVFANLMVGTAVVEYVFAWPGIGRLAIDSALVRDQPVVVGFTVAAGLIFTLMNLLVDVGIAAVDPRVRSL